MTAGDRGARTVVHFTDSALVGGAERALLGLATGLDRSRWRPVLAHHAHDGLRPLTDAIDAAGIERWVVPPMPEGLAGARAGARFARQLRRLRPSVVHAHMTWPLACKWPLFAAAAARVPAVVGTVQLYVDVPMGVSRRLQVLGLGRAVGRFIAVSGDTRRRLLDRFGWPAGKVRVVHNAVDVERFGAAAADPALRAALDPDPGRALALVPARLDPQKGHDDLLVAARELPRVRFVLAGDGPLRGELAARAERLGVADRVTFLGRRDDIPELLAVSDLVVLPSLYEGLPLSLIEAMAAGVPVVATDIGGTRELVESERTGLLVPARDPAALAAGIARMRADGALRDAVVPAARDTAFTRFSTGSMVDAVCREYRELLDAH